MKIIDSKECKVYKFGYSVDGSCLKLLYPVSEEKSVSVLLINESGDGDYEYYIVNCIGWGPVQYEDSESYETYKTFEKKMFGAESVSLGYLEDNKWKIMGYDIGEDYSNYGVELYSSMFIRIFRIKNTFYFHCYQENLDDLEAYDKYLSNIENVEEAEKVMREED